MDYRKEIEKIYKKIDSFAQRGDDSIMEFREYIDELIEYGKYSIFVDVMYFKYKIDVTRYVSVSDMKKDIYPKIKFQTKSKFSKSLKSIFDDKRVYTNGVHYYDSTTNKYLGEVNEISNYSQSAYGYFDTRLYKRLYESSDFNLEIKVGVSSSFYAAISKYADGSSRVIDYGTYSQVIYQCMVYECVKSYTWNNVSEITPTYSEYWSLSSVPTYSIFSVTGSSKSLIDKYEEAIDIMKSVN
jgi:hypothetical protein